MSVPKPVRRLHADTDENGTESLAYVHEVLLLLVITSALASPMPATKGDAGSGETAAIEVVAASSKKPTDHPNDGRGDTLGRLSARLSADGALWHENQALTVAELAERARARKAVKLHLQVDQQTPYTLLQKTLKSLSDAGLSVELS